MGTFLFKLKNIASVRPLVEKNRLLVASYFDWRYRRADPYRYGTSPEEQGKRKQVVAFLNDRRYGRILETGCGEGYMSGDLLSLGGSVLGFDISRVAVKRARKMHRRNPAVSFVRADLVGFKPRGEFDLIVCSEVLYYLNPDQIERVIRTLSGHLAPGGRLFSMNIFSRSESEAGLELKKLGAGTIHPLIEKASGMKKVRGKTLPGYEMVLFEKNAAP